MGGDALNKIPAARSVMAIILASMLLTILTAISAWDIYAHFGPGDEYTVSALIMVWSRQFLMLPLLAGMIAGHLFWSRISCNGS